MSAFCSDMACRVSAAASEMLTAENGIFLPQRARRAQRDLCDMVRILLTIGEFGIDIGYICLLSVL